MDTMVICYLLIWSQNWKLGHKNLNENTRGLILFSGPEELSRLAAPSVGSWNIQTFWK